MKTFLKFITIGLISTLIFSCTKDTEIQPIAPLQTSFKISVKDSNGTPVSGASVRLFTTLNDLDKETNQSYLTQYTDQSGETTFSSVNPIKYYFRIEKGCQSNMFIANSTQNALIAFSQNNATVSITSSGKLLFSNTSSNSYDIYVDNVLTIPDMAGGTNDSRIFPIGNHTIKVIQKTGYLLNPTIKTYTGTLLCGGNLLTTFP